MAEVARPASLGRQLWLVMLVRWLAFRNGLRSRSEKVHLIGSVAVGLFLSVLVLVASIGIGFAAYGIARSGNWLALAMVFWGIFLVWQVAPVLTSEMNPGFDGRNLLRFPLRFSTFFLMSAAYGVADPFALAGILWHAAIGVGVSIARPDLAWWAVLSLILSLAMNLLFNRLVFAWLERVLAKRRTREILTIAIVLLLVSLQFSGILFQRWGPAVRRAVKDSAGVWDVLPPALAGSVMQNAANGQILAALRTGGLLALYALAFGGLFALRVRAQFTGEDLGESAAPARPEPALKRPPVPVSNAPAIASGKSSDSSYVSRLVNSPAAAIFAKEFRYFYRNWILVMNAFMPLILIAFFALTPSMPSRRGGPNFLSRYGGLAYPSAAAYILLLMMNFCPNNLAYEGQGIDRLFLVPVKFRDVMLGKNLFHGALLALEALIALVLVAIMGHAPSVPIVLATWAGLLFAALMDLGTGNWLSIQFPRRFEFGVRRQRPSGSTMLFTFGIFFMEMGVIAATAFLCIWLAGVWLLPIAYLAWSAAALAVYRLILGATSRQAEMQRDTLLEQLSR